MILIQNIKYTSINLTFIRKSIVLLFIFLIHNFCSSQEVSLERFTVSSIHGKVYLEWLISSGTTCQGIRIFRSTDSFNFIQIGDIGGVCGNLNSPQIYHFTDENPANNKVNFYRLELGGIGLSKTISIEIIDFTDSGFQIRPNPVNSYARILFNNETRQNALLRVYAFNGAEVLNLRTSNDIFIIHTNDFQQGIYFFSISFSGTENKINGSFITNH